MSKPMRLTTESMDVRMSSTIFIRAVSVLCEDQYADWCGQKLGELVSWDLSLDKAKRSVIFDIVDRLVIGRKFFRSEVSRPGFFSRGVTRPSLCTAGNVAYENDWLVGELWALTTLCSRTSAK